MLNLSDKDLDRFAREAAGQYDPGDLTSPGSWERLRLSLDKELGAPRPNLFRTFRRMPFYYAPAILLLAAASYYIIKQGRSNTRTRPPATPATARAATSASPSGSPPTAVVRSTRPAQADGNPSIKNQINSYNSTSTLTKPTTDNYHASDKDRSVTAPGISAAGADRSTTAHVANGQRMGNQVSGQTPANNQAAEPGAPLNRPGDLAANRPNQASQDKASDQQGVPANRNTPASQNNPAGHHDSATNQDNSIGQNNPASRNNPAGHQNNPIGRNQAAPQDIASNPNGAEPISIPEAGTSALDSRGLQLSVIRIPPSPALPVPVIDDSGLRLLGARSTAGSTAKSADPINLGKKKSPSLQINKRLQLGFSIAPDFASVNAVAAQRPGSSIGITAEYQFFNKWHLQTGFLWSRKNYTAAEQDYHVPDDYYRMNNLHDVYFVNGSFDLLEIPLSLRYDFSIAGNTTFFISGGMSSYLVTHENCYYYFDLFGREAYQGFNYNSHQVSLFSTVDLSAGVETGLSNSLSLLIAPYMKIPTAGLGFGKVEMNSIGIDFALKYTPVLRRKRH